MLSTLKRNLFNEAAHRRLQRLSKAPLHVFHGFELTSFLNSRNLDTLSFLDVGCGFGIDMANASRNGFKNVLGVDVRLYDDWNIASHYYPNMTHIILEGKEIPFNDKSFDVVNSYHVFEHVPDDIFLINEVSRVLKEDGIAIICVPNSLNILTMFQSLLNFKNPYLDPTHLREYTLLEIKSKLEENGFEIISYSREGFVLPIPVIRRFYHFFSTTYFDFNGLNNFLGKVIPYTYHGHNFLCRKIL
jgi:SAM-dependent methyltransferase